MDNTNLSQNRGRNVGQDDTVQIIPLPSSSESSVPEKGQLVPLKTTLETRARDSVVEVYVTIVPVKLSSVVLSSIRALLPDDGGVDLNHLRRVAKIGDVPQRVRDSLEAARAVEVTGISEGETQTAQEDVDTTLNDESPTTPALVAVMPEKDSLMERLMVVGSTAVISQEAVLVALSKTFSDPKIFSVQVPLFAPTSPEQATFWSTTYWPTVYKKSNPFGPHPSIVSRAEQEIEVDVEKWMALATKAARHTSMAGTGEAIGVAVVERKNGVARAVAVAGDARWLDWPHDGPGNVTAHAAMRVIAMVAEGLRLRDEPNDSQEKLKKLSSIESAQIASGDLDLGQVDSQYIDTALENTIPEISAEESNHPSKGDEKTTSSIFRDQPSMAVEKDNYDTSGNEEGYLCHELEVYCTHEPCIMCSMAIVHSRFGRVVFENKMPETGGLCADGKLGHGLFWRKELNWTMLGWQWSCAAKLEGMKIPVDLHA